LQCLPSTTFGLATTLAVLAAGLAYWGVNAEAQFRQEQEMRKKAGEQALEQATRKAAERTDIVGQVVAYAASPETARPGRSFRWFALHPHAHDGEASAARGDRH